MNSWKEQYRHPQWQKRRLEVLQRAGFKCEDCGDTETALHVHHLQYIKGRAIWDYPDSNLRALCETCHSATHLLKAELNEFLAQVDPGTYRMIAGLVAGFFGPGSPFVRLDAAALESIAAAVPKEFQCGLIAGAVYMDRGAGALERQVAAIGELHAHGARWELLGKGIRAQHEEVAHAE